ncbi:MAG TPA: RecX family transcriptional regulator [Azospirillaceae bacterium]|nr:RecX family transcriptional regulator [Azospirillaceae bacterium]
MSDAPTGSRPDRRPAQGRKQPRRVTADYLERAALHYLERFASSSANLRKVLMRKVDLSARAHGTDREEGAAWVDALVKRYVDSGLLNDRLYADAKATGLQRRGGSTRMIRQKLSAKGLEEADIDEALSGLEGAEEGTADIKAALAYARRRRLGPYRLPEDREARRDKDMAALARAGFDMRTARRVVEAEDPDALEGEE